MIENDRRLDQIVAAYAAGDRSWRDSLIECGRLCHEFISDHVARGVPRSDCVHAIAARTARINSFKVNRVLGVYWVCRLLGPCGDMPYRSLREFAPTVKRAKDAQSYSIREGMREFAAALYQRALDGEVYADEIRAEVQAARKKKPVRLSRTPSVPLRASKPADDDDGEPLELPERYQQAVHPAVAACSAKDAAELLYETILVAGDPAAVARHLCRLLESKRFANDVLEKQRSKRFAV